MPARIFFSVATTILLATGSVTAQSDDENSTAIAKNDTGKVPNGARARLGKIAGFRYTGQASTATMSLDGRFLAVLQTIRGDIGIVDTASGKIVQTLPNPMNFAGQASLAFSPDGSVVAQQNFQDLRVWNVATGKELAKVQAGGQGGLRGQGPSLSRDGKIVGLGSDRFGGANQNVQVGAWDIAANKKVSVTSVHNHNIRVAIAPDGRTMASWGQSLSRGAGFDRDLPRTIQLWDLVNARELRQLKIDVGQFGGGVQAVAYSPDGRTLAVQSGTSAFHLIDAGSGKEKRRFAGLRSNGGGNSIFSPDGRLLATFGASGAVQVWEVATGKRLPLVDAPKTQVLAVAFPGKDRVIVLGMLADSLCWWDATDGASTFEGHLAPVDGIAFTPDGRSMISFGSDHQVIWWDRAAGKEQRRIHIVDESDTRFGGTGRPRSVAVSPMLNMPSPKTITPPAASDYGASKSGRPVCDLESSRSFNQIGVAFSPDSRRVAAAGGRSPLHVWDIASGEELAAPTDKQATNDINNSSRVAFSHDGALLAVYLNYRHRMTSQPMGDLIVWNVAGKKEIRRTTLLAGNTLGNGATDGMAFSIDDKLLAVPNAAGTIVLLSVPGGAEWRRFETQRPNSVSKLAFSPDGRFLAVGSAQRAVPNLAALIDEPVIDIWELASGQKREQLRGHAGGIQCLAFSADGATLASGSSDTTVILWDMTGGSSPKLPPLTQKELPAAWKSLGTRGVNVSDPIRRLVQSPALTLPFLKDQFKPAQGRSIDDKGLRKLIKDLDSSTFKMREVAAKSLRSLGDRAESALKERLGTPLSLELRRRVQELLEVIPRHEFTLDELLAIRTVEVLERIGTTEARVQLQAHSDADPAAVATRHARAALKRLTTLKR